MFKRLIKIAALLGVAAYLIFALTTINRPAQPSHCKGLVINITDTDFVNDDEVRQILHANKLFPEGQSFDDISLAVMESCLVASPYVQQALCYQTSEGKISINLTPRKPILHVINNSGEDFYIDNCGGTMPRAGHTTDLIVMTGNVPRKSAPALYSSLGNTINADTFWNHNIEEIHVTATGELQLTPREGNHIIILGDTSAIADKLSRLTRFYDEAIAKAGWNRYKTINVKFDNQIVCTKWE